MQYVLVDYHNRGTANLLLEGLTALFTHMSSFWRNHLLCNWVTYLVHLLVKELALSYVAWISVRTERVEMIAVEWLRQIHANFKLW